VARIESLGITKVINVMRRVRKYALMLLVIVLALIAFSAYHACKISDEDIRDNIAPPPFYGIRFVLRPNRYVDGVPELGFKPGWVITYLSHTKTYGTAFFVSIGGSMSASGTPSIVTKQHAILEKFQEHMEQIDASVPLGMAYSNVVATIGHPFSVWTNDGCVYTVFQYEPKVRYFPFITDGFEINFSNDVVFQKLPTKASRK